MKYFLILLFIVLSSFQGTCDEDPWLLPEDKGKTRFDVSFTPSPDPLPSSEFMEVLANLQEDLTPVDIIHETISEINDSRTIEYWVTDDTNTLITINWNNGSSCEVSAKSPNGNIYNEQLLNNTLGTTFGKSSLLSYIHLKNPIIGKWEFTIKSTKASSGLNKVTSHISSDFPIFTSTTHLTREVQSEEAIIMTLEPIEVDKAIKNATISGTVSKEGDGNQKDIIQFFDDGQHNDQESNDGIYGAQYLNTSDLGKYEVLFSIEGTTYSGKPFKKKVSYDFEVVKKA